MASNKKFNFTENNSSKELYKASLFKGLFAKKNGVLEGFPQVSKGLSFPDASLAIGGGANYTFKTSDVVDKLQCRTGDKEFVARYKKDTKKFDVSVHQAMPAFMDVFGLKPEGARSTLLLKYEECGTGAPRIVAGGSYTHGDLQAHGKYNCATGKQKYSALLNGNAVGVSGLMLGADMICNTQSLAKGTSTLAQTVADTKFNVGAAYNHNMGTTGVAYSDAAIFTLNHFWQVDKDMCCGLELAHPMGSAAPKMPMTVGVGYKLDSQHYLKARVNKNGECHVTVKKDVTPNCSIQIATAFDVANAGDLASSVPALGFKVAVK
jgi:hypothetical protein